MKVLSIAILFLISFTRLNGQVPCCIQRVLLTPTSSVYVNIATQSATNPTKYQHDAPMYQNPYNYQNSRQMINNNNIVMSPGPVITSTQKPSTTNSTFEITNAVPWNGNQTVYADEATLNKLYRDSELNEQNSNTSVNKTTQTTTQNKNQYYQGANAGWGNTNTNNTIDNSNNLSTQEVASIGNNLTTSSSQNGNINNTNDTTTSEFSDSGYIQIAGASGPVDMTAYGKAIENETPYNGTTVGTPLTEHNNGVQSPSASTGIYHNANINFGSTTQSSTISPNVEMQTDNIINLNNNLATDASVIMPQVYTSNPIINQENTISENIQTTPQTIEQSYLENSLPTQSTLLYTTDNDNYSSTTQSTILGQIGAGVGAGVATIGGIGSALVGAISNTTDYVKNATVFNPSSSTLQDADIAPLTHDSDYKYSDSGYITVGVADNNETTANQSGNSNIINSNVNNENDKYVTTQGTTIQQTNEKILFQSTQSGQFNQETSTPSTFNQESTINQETITNESTLNNINTETTYGANENVDNNTTPSTLLRDSTQNDGTGLMNNDDSSTDTITEHQNSASKTTGLFLSIVLIIHFFMFN